MSEIDAAINALQMLGFGIVIGTRGNGGVRYDLLDTQVSWPPLAPADYVVNDGEAHSFMDAAQQALTKAKAIRQTA